MYLKYKPIPHQLSEAGNPYNTGFVFVKQHASGHFECISPIFVCKEYINDFFMCWLYGSTTDVCGFQGRQYVKGLKDSDFLYLAAIGNPSFVKNNGFRSNVRNYISQICGLNVKEVPVFSPGQEHLRLGDAILMEVQKTTSPIALGMAAAIIRNLPFANGSWDDFVKTIAQSKVRDSTLFNGIYQMANRDKFDRAIQNSNNWVKHVFSNLTEAHGYGPQWYAHILADKAKYDNGKGDNPITYEELFK